MLVYQRVGFYLLRRPGLQNEVILWKTVTCSRSNSDQLRYYYAKAQKHLDAGADFTQTCIEALAGTT